MQLKTLYIKGFRNFKEVKVNFNEHSLMIGANDVGKTNLIYALRILLDRSLSDYDYELLNPISLLMKILMRLSSVHILMTSQRDVY